MFNPNEILFVFPYLHNIHREKRYYFLPLQHQLILGLVKFFN